LLAWHDVSGSRATLLAAFCVWDDEAMAAAACAMIEAVLERPLDEVAIAELEWRFRELLHDAEGHPNVSTSFRAGGVDLVLGVSGDWRGASAIRLELRFGVARTAPEAVRRRWIALGFAQGQVAIPRGQLAIPVPLKGEPGYGVIRRRSPHVPERPQEFPKDSSWAAGQALASGQGPWLGRYRRGEREAVWNEIAALGDRIRGADVFGDAVDVVGEMMRRARTALEALHERLAEQGYQFEEPAGALVAPPLDIGRVIAELETRVGLLPLSFCAFVSFVGSVDLRGIHAGWLSPGEAILDPLVVGPSEGLLAYDEDRWHRHMYDLEFAPDRFHKENISGGPPYSLKVPNGAADGIVENEATRPGFVELLRRSLRWAGFPGWANVAPSGRPLPLLAELTHDLPSI
jgi:hypothetical protein